MKQRNNEWLHWVLLTIPCIYMSMVYTHLPETVATHFGVDGTPNGFSAKSTFLWMIPMETWGLYLLIRYLPRIDPKKRDEASHPVGSNLRLILTVFLSGLCIFEIMAAQKGTVTTTGANYVFAGVGGLLCVLGNYMSTIKPNYFIGIRTPWTLENEYVWRKTNRVFGRIMTGLGALMVIAALLNINNKTGDILIGGIVGITLLSYPYSWYLYKKIKNKALSENALK